MLDLSIPKDNILLLQDSPVIYGAFSNYAIVEMTIPTWTYIYNNLDISDYRETPYVFIDYIRKLKSTLYDLFYDVDLSSDKRRLAVRFVDTNRVNVSTFDAILNNDFVDVRFILPCNISKKEAQYKQPYIYLSKNGFLNYSCYNSYKPMRLYLLDINKERIKPIVREKFKYTS